MLASFLALAASLTMIGPDVRSVLDPDDYPTWATRDQVSAAAQVELLIEPSGKVSRCNTLQTLGSERLAREICVIVKGRRVRPATDPTGVKVYGFVRTVLMMFLPDTEQGNMIRTSEGPPDAILTVTQLPGRRQQIDASVILLVDENGAVDRCAPAPYEPRQEIANTVCSGKSSLGVRPIVDLEGHPVRGIVNMKVRLKTSSDLPQANR